MSLPYGVNLAGYFESEKGLGEGARATLRALRAAGVPHVLDNVVDPSSANPDRGRLHFTRDNPYAINLVHLNAEQVPAFCRARGPDYFRGRVTVGFWNWELERFPAAWRGAFRFVDEVWTPSTHTQRAVAAVSPVPVSCFPYCVEVPGRPPPGVTRAALGLPEGAFLFLFAFDFQSHVERKNPAGAVRAFKRAFAPGDPVALVLKSVHAADRPAERAALEAERAGWPNILLLDRVLDREAMHGLIGLCDAVVSLHRAEGFGFLLAEAMAMGKPAVATAFSSNVDFMTAENSLPVRFTPVALERTTGPYERGATWAEPDVEHAAELMRALAGDPALAARLGARARADVGEQLAPARTGGLMRRRLEELHARGAAEREPLQALLWELRLSADPAEARAPSSRRILGGAVERLRRAATRLLHPSLARQRTQNELVIEALEELARMIQASSDGKRSQR